jgi:methylenetetrahydrofolate reductase (NADPH)
VIFLVLELLFHFNIISHDVKQLFDVQDSIRLLLKTTTPFSSPMTRIINKINALRQKCERYSGDPNEATNNKNLPPGSWYYSFEFFPPKTEAGLDNLLTRIDRMTCRLDPLFIDITWGSGGSTSARTLHLASHAQRFFGVDVLMHLTTTGMTRDRLISALDQAKTSGIHNVLVLRGDPPRGKRSWEPGDVSGGYCNRAIDLVKLIRQIHGNYFGIAVAGHPEQHPSSKIMDDEMAHLKEKIVAGADFIITQFFYDVSAFKTFVKRCRECGIKCPIIPGIMPIQSYSTFVQMTKYCGVAVPQSVLDRLEPVRNDDEAVKQIGCDIAVDMCSKILTDSEIDVDGVHFYTLNLERSATRILMNMGAIDVIRPESVAAETGAHERTQHSSSPSTTTLDLIRANSERQFPWRPSAMAERSNEEVRPINWANRPKSYVMRTEDWDEFPNGRWGDSSSPAFGELSNMSHFYSFSLGSEEDRRAMLGHEPKVPQEVYEVFARYVEGKIPHIPWCETSLQPESFMIQQQLAEVNRFGFLTINSQPSVNGRPSSDKIFGWGGSGGYVYQKEYCECFCSAKHAEALIKMVNVHPAMNLYAVNNAGKEMKVGLELGGVTALTWGVFPNREILQPTVRSRNM